MHPIRLHHLRHGAASLALQADADLKVIQEKLGHASVALTANTYMTAEPDLAHHEAEAPALNPRHRPPHRLADLEGSSFSTHGAGRRV